MTLTESAKVSLSSPDRFFIGGTWVEASTTDTIDVINASTEELFFRVAEAKDVVVIVVVVFVVVAVFLTLALGDPAFGPESAARGPICSAFVRGAARGESRG